MKGSHKIAVAAALAAPALFAGYVVLHPGVAYAETPLAKLPATTFAAKFQGASSLTIDPMHTSIGFEVGHMGLSRIQGRFDSFKGHIQADPKNLDQCSVELTIETKSVDTNVTPRDNHLRSASFFDVEKYPELTFKSEHIRKRGPGYVAEGQLTMHGVSKPISIPFKIFGPAKDPTGATRVGIVADPIKLNRSDYGINYGIPAVTDEVVIRLSAEATLDK